MRRWIARMLTAVLLMTMVSAGLAEDCGTLAKTDAVENRQTEYAAEEPTETPSEQPTEQLTEAPTEQPMETPTEQPTEAPAEQPTEAPAEQPTEAPTEAPAEQPTEAPTEQPTEAPTEAPTEQPTEAPTAAPAEVSLNTTTRAEVYIFDTLQLTLENHTSGTIRWYTSSSKIAAVSQTGLVTPKARGTVTITAVLNGKKKTIRVTVTYPDMPTGIAVSEGSTITMNVGETRTIHAEALGEDAVTRFTWKNSSAKILTVTGSGTDPAHTGEATIFARMKGTVTVTVTSTNGKSRKIKVIVQDPYNLRGISAGVGSTVALNVGETQDLAVAAIPAEYPVPLTITSSNPAVAAVSQDGIVTALSEGSAVITVSVGAYTKKIKVTVTDPLAPRSVQLSITGRIQMQASETRAVSAQIYPLTAVQTVTWKTGNKKIAYVKEDGTLQACSAGTTTITAVAVNGRSASFRVTVTGVWRVPVDQFVAGLEAALARHDGYIMHASGEDPKLLPSQFYTQYTDPEERAMAQYWYENAQRVWDCNGLAEGIYGDVTGTNLSGLSRTNYDKWCTVKGYGVIPANKRAKGVAVFKKGKAARIHHVGYLVSPVDPDHPEGDWYVIEAAGVRKGVIRTRLLENDWDYWGYMTKYFVY